jgi:hypothetical protein
MMLKTYPHQHGPKYDHKNTACINLGPNPKQQIIFTHRLTPVHKTVGILGNSVIHRPYNIIFLLKNLSLRRRKQGVIGWRIGICGLRPCM